MIGLWGITFLVTWLGSTVAWVAQRGWSTEALPVLLVYAIAWTVVMLFGGLRLAFRQPASTMRVATIGWLDNLVNMAEVVQLLQAEEVPKHNIVRLAEDLAGWESHTSIHGSGPIPVEATPIGRIA